MEIGEQNWTREPERKKKNKKHKRKKRWTTKTDKLAYYIQPEIMAVLLFVPLILKCAVCTLTAFFGSIARFIRCFFCCFSLSLSFWYLFCVITTLLCASRVCCFFHTLLCIMSPLFGLCCARISFSCFCFFFFFFVLQYYTTYRV